MSIQLQEGAVVLLSGGQDSTTCLFWAIDMYGLDRVKALCINYGQRHSIELDAARVVAAMAGVDIEVVTLPKGILASTSPLVDSSREVQTYADAQSLPGGLEDTFVPMRNMLFFTIAANRAVAAGVNRVVTGVSQEDYGGYPDCRAIFVSHAEQALNMAVGLLPATLRLDAPLLFRDKKATVELAVSMPACMDALEHSHTCYQGVRPPCGKCHACILRAKGFELAGIADPLVEATGG